MTMGDGSQIPSGIVSMQDGEGMCSNPKTKKEIVKEQPVIKKKFLKKYICSLAYLRF